MKNISAKDLRHLLRALDLIQLNSVTLGMFSKPTKQEDFWVSDIDFSCNADVSDVLGLLYTD